MTQKIEGPGAPAAPLPASPAGARAASAEAPVAAPPPVDRARLTGDAAGLATLQADLARNPTMDLARVQAVRAALESGTYRIDPMEIASRLTQLERELLG